jgi:anaerobic selenocysteine-containing dehydrogenase
MPDYEQTGCILLWGFNPTTSWLAQAESVTRALKRGAKLIVVDPRRAGLANRADEWLRVRPAADGPLAMALAHQLIINGWFDAQFIRDWSNGPLLVREDTEELLTTDDLNSEYSQHGYLANWPCLEHSR